MLKSGSHLPKKLSYLLHWKPFKMMKNAFHFILKALFIFIMTFRWSGKNGLIRKWRLISKFMTSQPWPIIAIHILPNISQSKTNQTMKLVQLMMMNCFCGMVDQKKAFSLISGQDHCQRSLPLWISDTLQGGFEPMQNPSSGLVEWSCAVVITTTWQHHRL